MPMLEEVDSTGWKTDTRMCGLLAQIRQKQMPQAPWTQLALGKCGRGGTEAKGIPLICTQRALEP